LAYDEDAIVMPLSGEAARRRAQILELLNTFPPFTEFDQNSLELEGLGDLAYSRDEYWWKPEIPGVPGARQTGKALTIWRRQADGSWKMFREMWNTDAAAAV